MISIKLIVDKNNFWHKDFPVMPKKGDCVDLDGQDFKILSFYWIGSSGNKEIELCASMEKMDLYDHYERQNEVW